MANSDIEIKLGLDSSEAEADAKSAGKSIGEKAGNGVEQGMDSGSKSGAKKAAANVDDGSIKSAGKSAGDKAGKSIGDGIGEGTKKGVEEAESAVDGLRSGIETALGAIGVGAGISGVFELVQKSAESSFAKVESGAKAAGVAMENAVPSYEDFVGITGDAEQATEAVNNAFRLCQGNTENLSEWTNIAAGAYATLGDSLPIENLTESANETARTGVVVGGMADALNWATLSADQWRSALGNHSEAQAVFNNAIDRGMSAEDAFNEALASCNDEQERGQLITDTLSNIYSDAGQSYLDTNSAAIEFNKTSDELNRTLQDLGGKYMPTVTDALRWLVDNGDIVASVVVAIAAGFVTMQIAGAVSAMIQTFTTALESATVAQALFNAVLNANPIVMVITLIAALAAGLVYFFTQTQTGQQIWSDFTSFIGSAVNDIKNRFDVAVAYITLIWNVLVGYISSIPGRIQGFFSGVASWFSSTFDSVKSGIQNGFDAAVDFVSSIPGKIKGFFSDAGSWLINSGKSILDGLTRGIRDGFSSAVNAVKSGLENIRSYFPFSPAKRGPFSGRGYTTYSGRAIMRDLGKGMTDGAKGAKLRAEEALASVQKSLTVPLTYSDVRSSVSGPRYVTNETRQTINFNQPVQSPDAISRMMRMQARYGLAGAR